MKLNQAERNRMSIINKLQAELDTVEELQYWSYKFPEATLKDIRVVLDEMAVGLFDAKLIAEHLDDMKDGDDDEQA